MAALSSSARHPGQAAAWWSAPLIAETGEVRGVASKSFLSQYTPYNDVTLAVPNSFQFDLFGQRGPGHSLGKNPRGTCLTGRIAGSHCPMVAVASRARLLDRRYREVATLLAHAREGASTWCSTGPPANSHT